MTKMRQLIRRTVLAGCALGSVAMLGLGCKSITNYVEVEELQGFWVASKLRFADPKNLNKTVDAIAEVGASLTLRVDGAGGYTRVLTDASGVPDSATGTLTVENGKDITLTSSTGNVATGEVFMEDNQISLLFDENQGLTADIDGSGNEVPVTLLTVMDRQ
jgi:hypothetical protein